MKPLTQISIDGILAAEREGSMETDRVFTRRQEVRIERRIAYCKKAIRSGRTDAAFKAEKILPQQESALIRLRIGFYGVCVECGGEISKSRLRIVPAAVRCLPCQARHEE